MDICALTTAAKDALQEREDTGSAVDGVTVEPVTDSAGWTSYAGSAALAHRDGTTGHLDIRDTALARALEWHADDEAELGCLQTVFIPIPQPAIVVGSTVWCEAHTGTHSETNACRWPHDAVPGGDHPQLGHPYRVSD